MVESESVAGLWLSHIPGKLCWMHVSFSGWLLFSFAEVEVLLSFPYTPSQQPLMSSSGWCSSSNLCAVQEELEKFREMDTPPEFIFPTCLCQKILGYYINIFIWIWNTLEEANKSKTVRHDKKVIKMRHTFFIFLLLVNRWHRFHTHKC